MNKFDVRISEIAEINILNIDNYIVNVCKSPRTAKELLLNNIFISIKI
jgi:hypothetical protein